MSIQDPNTSFFTLMSEFLLSFNFHRTIELICLPSGRESIFGMSDGYANNVRMVIGMLDGTGDCHPYCKSGIGRKPCCIPSIRVAVINHITDKCILDAADDAGRAIVLSAAVHQVASCSRDFDLEQEKKADVNPVDVMLFSRMFSTEALYAISDALIKEHEASNMPKQSNKKSKVKD